MTQPSLAALSNATFGTGLAAARPAHYGDPIAEQRAWLAGNGYADGSHLAVVRISGPDRLTWLNALASQRLDDLAPGESREALILDAHGHIEQAFGVIDDGESAALIVAEQAADALAEYLSAMVFRKRVTVARAKDVELIVTPRPLAEGRWPQWRDPWPGVVPGGTRLGSPSDQHPGRDWSFVVTLAPAGQGARWAAQAATAGLRPVGFDALEALRVAAWRPRARADIDERTLPAELDWLRTAVHLDKGCYRGQESVAKIHNVGRPPRRLVQLQLDGSGHTLPDAGSAVLAGEAIVGRITTVARHIEQGPIALGVVRRTLPAGAALLVRGADGDVAASQELIVPVDGTDADRPTIVPPARRAKLL